MRTVSLAFLAALIVAVSAPMMAQQRVIAIENVTVLPMDGRPPMPKQTVLVRGEAIALVGDATTLSVPSNALRIDGRGRYVMPGLTDAHVHLEARPEEWLPLFLASGVTTVFNLRGSPEHLALRERVRRGEVLGPTIYTSGPYANLPGVASLEDADRVAAEQKRAGYDFIKIHGNLAADVNRRLGAAAKANGIALIGHAPRNLPFDSVLTSGQIMVAHAEELEYTYFQSLDTLMIPAMAKRMAAAGVWLTPTLSTFHGISSQWARRGGADSALALAERAYLNGDLLKFWTTSNPYTGRPPDDSARINRMYVFQLSMVKQLHEAGVRLLTGTDTPLPIMYPGSSIHLELEELVLAGLTRAQALESATRNAGEFVNRYVDHTAHFGTIAPGARADLVLLERNPLDDLAAARHPLGVMLRGRWVPKPEIDAMLKTLADRNAGR